MIVVVSRLSCHSLNRMLSFGVVRLVFSAPGLIPGAGSVPGVAENGLAGAAPAPLLVPESVWDADAVPLFSGCDGIPVFSFTGSGAVCCEIMAKIALTSTLPSGMVNLLLVMTTPPLITSHSLNR